MSCRVWVGIFTDGMKEKFSDSEKKKKQNKLFVRWQINLGLFWAENFIQIDIIW